MLFLEKTKAPCQGRPTPFVRACFVSHENRLYSREARSKTKHSSECCMCCNCSETRCASLLRRTGLSPPDDYLYGRPRSLGCTHLSACLALMRLDDLCASLPTSYSFSSARSLSAHVAMVGRCAGSTCQHAAMSGPSALSRVRVRTRDRARVGVKGEG